MGEEKNQVEKILKTVKNNYQFPLPKGYEFNPSNSPLKNNNMSATILHFNGDLPFFRINGNPNAEAAAITAALQSMINSTTIPFGSRAIDDNGDEYKYINTGGGMWRRVTVGAF